MFEGSKNQMRWPALTNVKLFLFVIHNTTKYFAIIKWFRVNTS